MDETETTADDRVELTDLRTVAEAFDELGERMVTVSRANPFEAITIVGKERLPHAAGASITNLRHDQFVTVAATNDRVRRADAIQYELGSGPCVDAILEQTTFRPRDLATDSRWPDYGQRVTQDLGLRSMLSYRMRVEGESALAGLNFYGDEPDAFTDRDALVGLLLATHGAQAAALIFQRNRVSHLERALGSNRRIGMAMGILMARHKVTEDQAFDLLRIASQNSNRKLADVAADVVDTGTLDVTPPQRRA